MDKIIAYLEASVSEVDEEEIGALVEHRGLDEKTARVAYQISQADSVDLAKLILRKQ